MSTQEPLHTIGKAPENPVSSREDESKANSPLAEPVSEKTISSKDIDQQTNPYVTAPMASSSTAAIEHGNQTETNVIEVIPKISPSTRTNENEDDVELPDDDFGDAIDVDFDVYQCIKSDYFSKLTVVRLRKMIQHMETRCKLHYS